MSWLHVFTLPEPKLDAAAINVVNSMTGRRP